MPRDQVSESELLLAPRGLPACGAPVSPSSPVVTVLREARALVAKGWCRMPFAKDAAGNSIWDINADSLLNAVAFCADGALWRVYRGGGCDITTMIQCQNALRADAIAHGYEGHIWLNHSAGQSGVLDSFDRAIALAEQERT